MGGDGGEAGGSPAAAAAAADDPASAILLLYSSLADVQAVLEADSADADALKVREGEAMRERSDGARGREKKKNLINFPSPRPIQLRADLQAAAAEAESFLAPSGDDGDDSSPPSYTPTWAADPLDPPPSFAALAAAPGAADLAAALAAGRGRLDFTDPAAVRALTRATLTQSFGLAGWALPDGALVPPVAARAAYLRRMGLIVGRGTPPPRRLAVLDVGCGASLIFCLLAASPVFGWVATGLDVTAAALAGAAALLALNPALVGRVRLVAGEPPCPTADGASRPPPPILAPAFEGPGTSSARYDLSVCNPPFFESVAARAATAKSPGAPHGGGHAGTPAETVWPAGGEAGFVAQLAIESAAYAARVTWWSTMLGRKASVGGLRRVLAGLGAAALGSRPRPPEVRTFTLAEGGGRTTRWVVAWSWTAEAEAGQGRKRGREGGGGGGREEA